MITRRYLNFNDVFNSSALRAFVVVPVSDVKPDIFIPFIEPSMSLVALTLVWVFSSHRF
jgi:hypothetical protein